MKAISILRSWRVPCALLALLGTSPGCESAGPEAEDALRLDLLPTLDETVERKGADDEVGPFRPFADQAADSVGGVANPGAIDPTNDPTRLDPDYVRVFEELPLSGRAERVPWTDTYWPDYKGGIAWRWQDDVSHEYDSPALEELQSMEPEAIARLSPAEKYDLLTGSYDYPLTIRLKSETRASTPKWQGHCHGWAPASIEYAEPHPVTMTNPDGIEIPFGSADVKALLTYFKAEVVRTRWDSRELHFAAETRAVGSVCGSGYVNDPSCYDTNPGAFHVVMANQLGLRGEAFGIDAEPTREKWNQPVHSYEAEIIERRPPREGASPDAVEEVVVSALVVWTQEIEPTWEAVGGTPLHADDERRLDYTVELDAEGVVVGGQWLVQLSDGSRFSLHEVFEFLSSDRDGDGTPDLAAGEASAVAFEHFRFPDYVWVMSTSEFSESYRPADSGYSFIANTLTTRAALYDYFAKLGELYRASTGAWEQ